MSSPIGSNGVNPTLPTVTTSTTSTTGTIGTHSVSTTAPSDSVASTSATTSSAVAEPLVNVQVTTTEGGATTTPVTAKVTTSSPESSPSSKAAKKTEQVAQHSGIETSEEADFSIDGSHTESTQGEAATTSSHSAEETSQSADVSGISESSSGLPELTIPPYDPTNKASLLELMKNPAVQGQMKQKCGHYIWPDMARGSFVFIPNGDWNKIQSITVRNGRTKEQLYNPKDTEKWVCKFAASYDTMKADWEGRRSDSIRTRGQLDAGTPVKFTNFVLNSKFKTAVAYGPYNAKEAGDDFTPSAWKRGTKVSVPKSIWDDTGGWDPLMLNQDSRSGLEEATFSSELPSSGTADKSTSTPGATQMPPINVHVNLGGVQTTVNTTGGPVSQTDSHITENRDATPGEVTDSSSDDGSSVTGAVGGDEDVNEPTDTGDNVSESSSSSVEELATRFVDEGPGHDNMAISDNLPSPSSSTDLSSNNDAAPLHSAAQGVTDSLGNLLGRIRAHLDSVYDPNGNLIPGHNLGTLGDIIAEDQGRRPNIPRNTPQISGQFVSTGPVSSGIATSESVPGEASVDTTLTASSKELSSAAQETMLSLSEMLAKLKPVTQEPAPTPPSNDLLNKIRAHLDAVYDPDGNIQPDGDLGNLGDIVAEHEGKTSPTPTTSPLSDAIDRLNESLTDSTEGGDETALMGSLRTLSSNMQSLLGGIVEGIATQAPSLQVTENIPPSTTSSSTPILQQAAAQVAGAMTSSATGDGGRATVTINSRPWGDDGSGKADTRISEAAAQVASALSALSSTILGS